MVKFSKGPRGTWDKMKPENRKVGYVFTTARGYTPQKQSYYCSFLDKENDEIWVEGKLVGKAVLFNITYKWTDDLTLEFWKSDTYQDATWNDIWSIMDKFYRNNTPFLIILHYKWTEVF